MNYLRAFAIPLCCSGGIVLSSCGGSDHHSSSVETVALNNFQAADFALQTDSSDSGLLSSTYGNPTVTSDGALWVADYGNSRLLRFSPLPSQDGTDAEAVSTIQYTDASDTVQDYDLDGVQNAVSYDGKLLAPLYDDDSVVIFDSVPVPGEDNTGIILGTSNFATAPDGSCSANGMSSPETVSAGGDKLVVADAGHNRLLIWNSVPVVSGTAPDLVLGQYTFTTCANNDDDQDGSSDGQPSARTLSYPSGVWTNGKQLLVNDYNNNRVLIWNTFPTENFQPADLVLGQPDFATAYANDTNNDTTGDDPSAQTLSSPYDGIYSNGVQIFVADQGNNRMLIWNSWPAENRQAADIVLGQSDFTHTVAYDDDQDDETDSATLRTMSAPNGVFQYKDKLIVVDNFQRILFFTGN